MWAVDGVVYGPVELPTLVCWVKEERVLADTWIYVEHTDLWQKAAQVAELKMFFRSATPSTGSTTTFTKGEYVTGIKPSVLRRVKILGDLSDQQLERFAQLMELMKVRQFEEVVRQNSPGDAMYLVLEGEDRKSVV